MGKIDQSWISVFKNTRGLFAYRSNFSIVDDVWQASNFLRILWGALPSELEELGVLSGPEVTLMSFVPCCEAIRNSKNYKDAKNFGFLSHRHAKFRLSRDQELESDLL